MPYKTDSQAIRCPFLDRRTKLLPCQKEQCIYLHNIGRSITGIAKMFKVNKRLIQFVIFPDRQKKNIEDREARGGTKQYYNRLEHNEAMKDHRKYKHNILTIKQIT